MSKMPQPAPRNPRWPRAFVAAACIGLLSWVVVRLVDAPVARPGPSRIGPADGSAARNNAGTAALSAVPAARDQFAAVAAILANADANVAAGVLATLANSLRGQPVPEVVAALVAALDSGVDAPTGMVFKIGPDGYLAAAPTLRVWMLDLLGQIDRAAAANYASRIYASYRSSDEWAIALREDWRDAVHSGRIVEVRRRALEMFSHAPWVADPSIGFLSAVDYGVASAAWEAIPIWEGWMQQSPALRGAAWIGIDRLALEVPEDFLPWLAGKPEMLASQPMLRAGVMARADVASERQRAAVEGYLRRPDLRHEEAEKFFALFPNANVTVSHTLASTRRAPAVLDVVRLDRAALQAVRTWRSAAEFSRWSPLLGAAEQRIGRFVAEAEGSGLAAHLSKPPP